MLDALTHVILDFDGTCTLVEDAAPRYLEVYGERISAVVPGLTADDWLAALEAMRGRSPRIGWTLAITPSAPAAADPYILAFETASLILRERGLSTPPPVDFHKAAYVAAPAEWRPDAAETLSRLIELGIMVAFVSNSSSTYINHRLDQLFPGDESVRARISVHSDAGKFRISEPSPESNPGADARARFDSLPAALEFPGLRRPVYLHRADYYAALGRALGGDFSQIGRSLVCGDIWELDLAMPQQLGACIHLLERAPPFDTYEYEREAVATAGERAKTGQALSSLLDWFY